MNALLKYTGILVLTTTVTLNFSGCKEDPVDPPVVVNKAPKITVTAVITNGGEEVGFDEAFTDALGNNVKVLTMKYYLANIELKDASGQYLRLSDIELFDHKPVDATLSSPQWRKSYTYEVPEGSYEAIRFGIGVPGDLNGLDPTDYANEHPLSTYSNMYWSWATMYRFIVLEAEMDTAGGQVFEHDVIFHTGLDELYRASLELPRAFVLEEGDEVELVLEIDWNQLFFTEQNSIDIIQESHTHTTDSPEQFYLAERFTENFVKGISLR